MSDTPWSNNPNAPQISSLEYLTERGYLAGALISAILFGITTALFFQCIVALLNPINRASGGVKWWLVAHAAAMFIFLTTPLAIGLNALTTDFINGRNFPGNDELPPGPLGYDNSIAFEAVYVVGSVMFPLNQWLSDGFLLYRCFIIYSTNYWAVAFPCLLYLASIGMGIAYIYLGSSPDIDFVNYVNIETSFFSICFALNVLLTLMIVTRLVLHRWNFGKAVGTSNRALGPYTTIITIIVESYALYATALLLYIVPLALNSWVADLFKGVGMVQVISPYLIILRVAKRRAVTSAMVSSGSKVVGSMQFRSEETTAGDESLPEEGSTSSVEPVGEVPGGSASSEAKNGLEEVPRRRIPNRS